MSQGNDFANYSASADEGSNAAADVWFVAVASDDIKQMTIDQLDEAFRLGVISAQTAVWTEGMEAWAPLGEVADLDGNDAEDAAPAAEAAPETLASAASPLASSDALASSPLLQGTFGSSAPGFSPSPTNTSSMGASSPFSQEPSFGASQSFAPGPSSFAPVTSSLSPGANTAPLLQTSVPVALNVDENMMPMGQPRRFRIERWLLAAAGIAAVGFAAYNNSDVFSASAASPVAAADTQAPSFAARPYEVGGGSEAATEKKSEAAAKPAADDDEDAPIGSAAPSKEDRAAADEAAREADATEDEQEPEARPAKDSSLKGSFSKAFNKKPTPAAKTTKTSKAKKASRSAKASKPAKKSGAPRAASAFDPLNDSLP